MTRRAWILVSIAYAILAAGAVVSLLILQRQTDRLDNHQKALIQEAKEVQRASLVFCEVSRRNDPGEARVLRVISEGKTVSISPECVRLVARIFHQRRG